jgi:hypothetical protein
MAATLPSRLLGLINGQFQVFNPRSPGAPTVDAFDIISYTWSAPRPEYRCGIPGVTWNLTIDWKKIEEIKNLMSRSEVRPFMWVDCLCINQSDKTEKSFEISKMYEYYKSARQCHILIDMPKLWDQQKIVDDLKFVDHILSNMVGASLASETKLSENVISRLSKWATDAEWAFPLEKSLVRSASIDMGLLNCYATCTKCVASLFDNFYFSRVWTFEEMLLGKNITMWAIHDMKIAPIGQFDTWMDLATDSNDKAVKLHTWIQECRVLNTSSVNAILGVIEDDMQILGSIQLQVKGISCARTDIITGGPRWWHENQKGISNIFSAISITPRSCYNRGDIFKGLLGVFHGLFTPEEIRSEMKGDDLGNLSFIFFKQLSLKTGDAWTRLAISRGEREEWDWIPMVANPPTVMSTDCFAGVVRLGRLKENGSAKAIANTGIDGSPKKYIKILLHEGNGDFQLIFNGCNCGKSVKTGRVFGHESIPPHAQPEDITTDETGRRLVQFATMLGSILDPAGDIVEYRKRLLDKLQPTWDITDPIAKPTNWIDRCVNGTFWETPYSRTDFRPHNMTMNYRMRDIKSCRSRLHNESTKKITCEVRVNCGCTIFAPFSMIFHAITAIEGSSLGNVTANLEQDRIILQDGMGLVQVGDACKIFDLIAFDGEDDAHKKYAHECRSTRIDKQVVTDTKWPKGRALVRADFSHDLKDGMRDYGYVPTGENENIQSTGSGNLLICRKHPLDPYKIIGVCIEDEIKNKKAGHSVTIR